MEQQGNEVLDTFDEGPYTTGSMGDEGEGFEDSSEEQGTEEVSKQAQAEEEIDTDSQVNMLDNSEEKGEKEDSEDDEEAGKGDEKQLESKPDEEDGAAKNDGDTAEKVRNIKAFRDGKAYEIPEDAEVKVKVKGKWEKVPLTELRDNYAGKVAYDEKFASLNEEVKQFKSQEEAYNNEIGTIRNHLGHIAQLTKQALDGEVNPTAGMEYLIDLMGGNSLQYKKAMYESMAEELDLYYQMTEVEREAFWVKQENNYLTKRQESLMSRQSEEQTRAELQKKVNDLREAHGISVDDYESAKEDLKLGGMDENLITPENIVQAARLKPLLLEAERLLEPYTEQMSDKEFSSMSREIATTMFEAPSLPIESIKKLLAEQYEVEDIVSTLVNKTEKAQSAEIKSPTKTNHLESFDDFDDY